MQRIDLQIKSEELKEITIERSGEIRDIIKRHA